MYRTAEERKKKRRCANFAMSSHLFFVFSCSIITIIWFIMAWVTSFLRLWLSLPSLGRHCSMHTNKWLIIDPDYQIRIYINIGLMNTKLTGLTLFLSMPRVITTHIQPKREYAFERKKRIQTKKKEFSLPFFLIHTSLASLWTGIWHAFWFILFYLLLIFSYFFMWMSIYLFICLCVYIHWPRSILIKTGNTEN